LSFSLREPGLLISSVAHVALLVGGLVTFSSVAPFPDADEGIPVEFITEEQFSQAARGERDAPREDESVRRVDRIAETESDSPPGEARRDVPTPPTRPQDMAVAETPEPEPQPEPQPAPEPAPEPEPVPEPEPAPAPSPEPAPEPAPAPPEPEAEPQADAPTPLPPSRTQREAAQRAAAQRDAQREAEQREAAQREAAERERVRRETAQRETAERRPQQAAPREAEVAERFDPDGIAALLRSTEEPASRGTTGPQLRETGSLGADRGEARRLSATRRDALIGLISAQLQECWQAPPAARSLPEPPVASLRIALNTDGSLAADPQVVNGHSDRLFQAVADSASRATRRCAPLRIPAEFSAYYDDWRVLVVNFDPRDG